jgi:hypothetical protein
VEKEEAMARITKEDIRSHQLPPEFLNVHLLRSSFYGSKIKEFEYSTHTKKEKENIVDSIIYQQSCFLLL